MISVADAQAHILAQVATVAPPQIVALTGALGRVLAEDVRAPIDVPPTDNSAVDGYAVAHVEMSVGGRRDLEVVGELPAGGVFTGAIGPGEALRIMTGAPMPAGADTVYPQEVVERAGRRITVGPIERSVNTRRCGEDVRAGSVVLSAGCVLRPQELGVAG
jgi:molybdopterin molybdotransferase